LNDLEYINYVVSSPASFGSGKKPEKKLNNKEQKEFKRALESEATWHLNKEILAATSSTIKFTPHYYYNEPLLKLLKNPNLRQIWASTNNNTLMVQIKEKKFQGKNLKGLQYSEHLIHFFSLLSEKLNYISGSTLPHSSTSIETLEDIYLKINYILENDAVATQVH
ncbi:3616_t:CDS:2, partial [Gigaspora margarita]